MAGRHKLIGELGPWSAGSESVKRLERLWNIHNMRELRLSANWAKSSGKNPGAINPSDPPSLPWRLYSQPLHDNWRAFVGSTWDEGDFEEGTAHQEIALGGVEYRGRDLEVSLEARADWVEDRRFGPGLSGTYKFDDHWSLPFSFHKLSPETPLRARHSRITADSASVGLGYYWNDYHWLNLETLYLDFSDGNERLVLSGDFNQRLWTWYTLYLNGQINFSASHDSQNANRPDLNPKDDREIGLDLAYGSILWRSYERVLSHEISAGVGDYWRKYFGSDVLWNVGYSQSLDWDDRFSATCGLN